jgi:polyisoprenyl-phosphate glycosyltransferase
MQSINVSYEYVFINDYSKDDSLTMIKHLAEHDSQVKYLDFSRNFGHQIAKDIT